VLLFFSSRRRHTMFSRDWSSDVCSSDLLLGSLQGAGDLALVAALLDHHRLVAFEGRHARPTDRQLATVRRLENQLATVERLDNRSEERRVGRECRAMILWQQ